MRTLWESYVGWFKLRSSTELYPDSTGRALAELTEAAGTDAVLDRAEAALARGEAPLAIRLGEAVVAAEPDSARGVAVVAPHTASCSSTAGTSASGRTVGCATNSPVGSPD